MSINLNCVMAAPQPSPILGVLGGMGPLATVDFLGKLIAATPASCDQDHLRLLVVSDPSVPDRNDALASGRYQAVLGALKAGLARLASGGAEAAVMPCNTAHHWFDGLSAAAPIPLLHIADAAVAELKARTGPGSTVVVLSTPATRRSGFYEERLRREGYRVARLPARLSDGNVMRAIRAVKAGRVREARARLDPVLRHVDAIAASAVLLACTELPLALANEIGRDPRLIDVNDALAGACVAWARARAPYPLS